MAPRSVLNRLARGLIAVVALLLVLIGATLALLETSWGKDQLRALIVRQANQYLTARLEIRRLGGSIFRGIQLGGIRLSQDGRTLVSIDEVDVGYTIRQLLQEPLVVDRIAITKPIVVAGRQADGRWDLASIVRRQVPQERAGPGRPVVISSIEIRDADVTLTTPVSFGATHIPSRYESLNATASFRNVSGTWRLDLREVSWRGSAPDLTMDRLSGGIENGPEGLTFDDLSVQTPRSAFTVAGRIDRTTRPTALDLKVHADRFAFQEWGGILNGLRNIAVKAAFDTALRGPVDRLGTTLDFKSDAGTINGSFVLNPTVPGWLGAGYVDVTRIDLAKWLSKPDKPSDISGRATFDLAFGFGEHFPRGSYAFQGPHTMFMRYAGDRVKARGVLTADAALITEATAVAYGADVRIAGGSIGLTDPFPFHFPGTVTAIDLRRLPAPVPVPHVESLLTFDYDVTGRFSRAFIAGRARFAQSEFLGATIGDGTVGTIDTGAKPLAFGGDGEISGVNLRRFGQGLQVEWMQDPRYAGTISGRFHVDGSGTDRASLALTGGGRLRTATLAAGRLSDADVTIAIGGSSLETSFDGRFTSLDPAVFLGDERFAGSFTGSGNVRIAVNELLARSPGAADFDVEEDVTLQSSVVRGISVDAGHFNGTIRQGAATMRHLDAAGPGYEAKGSGVLSFASNGADCVGDPGPCGWDFDYTVSRLDLARFQPLAGKNLAGILLTTGHLSGPMSRPQAQGELSLTGLAVPDLEAETVTGRYDVQAFSGDPFDAAARLNVDALTMKVLGRPVETGSGTLTLADRRASLDVKLNDPAGHTAAVSAAVAIHPEERQVTIADATVAVGTTPWRLAHGDTVPVITWDDSGIAISNLGFTTGTAADQRIGIGGTWRRDGTGALRITASHVFLDTLEAAVDSSARLGGVMDLDATVRGTRSEPLVTSRVTITDGRVRRFGYQRLAGRVDYATGDFTLDVRLDQSPGVWITAAGKVPAGIFDRTSPERPVNVAVHSSPIGLGLLEGLTDVVRNVSGNMQVNVDVVGTSRDPHFVGTVDLSNAAFLVVPTGSRYANGRADIRLSTDRIDINVLHIEDSSGRPLDLRGSLGTHEFRVGELEIAATTRHFEVMRNELGRVDIDAALGFRGRFETPRVGGDLTINGGDLNIDRILERTLFRPYSTEPIAIAAPDVVAALNPWDRLGLDLSLHIPQSLRLVGKDVQVAQGTPIGLGDINLRVGGDLYLYKDAEGPLSVTGSLDAIRGTYRFQGRPFDIDEPTSSINFRGDLNPELYVTVRRLISGVDTRVTITGNLRSPELQLSSTPPLDSSDILSLIVFNTNANALSVPQQQELAVRAAAMAAGFLATPVISAIERSLGLDILQLEPTGEFGGGPRVTIGEQLAPGLVARFSRQFGQDEFSEAVLEYYLSRLLRIRATFSDAGSLNTRSPFRRIERAGVDLLLFFSF